MTWLPPPLVLAKRRYEWDFWAGTVVGYRQFAIDSHQFVLHDESGKQHPLTVSECDLIIRDGHHITVVGLTEPPETYCYYFAVVNHTTQQWRAHNGFVDMINKRGARRYLAGGFIASLKVNNKEINRLVHEAREGVVRSCFAGGGPKLVPSTSNKNPFSGILFQD